MVRLPWISLPDIYQNIIQRGVSRQACFTGDEDLAAYVPEIFGIRLKTHNHL